MRPLIVGYGCGFFVAMQLGPMSLFLIRSTLRRGWATGIAVGCGIAVIDGVYAACGAAGVAPVLRIDQVRVALGVTGALVLSVLAVRTLRSAMATRVGAECEADVARPGKAFLTALSGTASNPATIASWAAIFAAASTAGAAHTAGGAALLVVGVAIGSLTWVAALASFVAVVRRGTGARARRTVDACAGVGMLGFAGALGYSTLHDR